MSVQSRPAGHSARLREVTDWPAAGTRRRPLASIVVLEPGAGRLTAPAQPARRWRRPALRRPLGVGGSGEATPAALPSAIRETNRRPDVMTREAIVRRALAIADIAAAAAALLLSVVLIGHRTLHPLALLSLPLIVIAAKTVGIYDRDELLVNNTTLDETPRLFQLATLNALLFVLLEGWFVSPRVGAGEIAGLWLGMLVFAVLLRASARGLTRRLCRPERCLFVGSEAGAGRLRDKLAARAGQAELIGRMTIDAGSGAAIDAAEAIALLERLVEEWQIQRVIVEPGDGRSDATLDFVRGAKETGARVSLLPRILEVVGSSIEIDDVDGLTLLGVRRFGLSRSSAVLKRAFDIGGAGLLTVLLSPLLVLLAALVRLDSPGPAFYRQTRVGRGGRPFVMFKLRTMVDGADALKAGLRSLNEADGLFKIAADPRITRVGGWLRRLSLDELPQLFNVLRGEMSLVGPRPLVPDDDEQIVGLDRRRLYLTPGMTGQWQILGSSRVPLAEMIKLDYLYVTGWSLWSDVKLLLRTVPYVLARRGL